MALSAEREKEIRRTLRAIGAENPVEHSLISGAKELLGALDAERQRVAMLEHEVGELSTAVNDGGLNYERLLSDEKTKAQKLRAALETIHKQPRCGCGGYGYHDENCLHKLIRATLEENRP